MIVMIELKMEDATGQGGELLRKFGFKNDRGPEIFTRSVVPESDDELKDPADVAQPFIERLADYKVRPRRVRVEVRSMGLVTVAALTAAAGAIGAAAEVLSADRGADILDSKSRTQINAALEKAGFDGNSRFRTIGAAIGKAVEVINQFGIEQDDTFNAHTFNVKSGRAMVHLAFSNEEDPFSPVSIDNAMLVMQWYTHESTDQLEVIAYVS